MSTSTSATRIRAGAAALAAAGRCSWLIRRCGPGTTKAR